MHSAFLDRYIEFTLRRRWLVLASSAAVMLILTAGLQFINISNDWRDMLDEDNPQLVAYDALEDTYTATNAAVIALAPKGGSVFTREALGAIEELTEAAWQVPWSSRVDSLTNYNHSESVDDDLNVERLVDGAESLSDEDLARAARHVIDHAVEPRLAVQRSRLLQLDRIVVDPHNPGAGLIDDPAHRAADPATDVDHGHALSQLQLGDHQPLMPDNGVLQALLRCQRRKVQGFAPTPHHELAAEVIVVLHRFGMVVPPRGLRRRPVDPAVEVLHATAHVRPVVRLLERV